MGLPIIPTPLVPVPFSAMGTHRGGNIIGPGEPKKSCLWLTGPFEALPLVGGTPQELGIGLSNTIGQGVVLS